MSEVLASIEVARKMPRNEAEALRRVLQTFQRRGPAEHGIYAFKRGDTLVITGEISGNRHYKKMWRNVFQSVKQGKKIVNPLFKASLLPKAVVQMISAGEESGKLGEVLDEVSGFYAKKLRETIKTVTSMIEPVMIIVMGSVVGFIAMAIILPIFKLSTLVK